MWFKVGGACPATPELVRVSPLRQPCVIHPDLSYLYVPPSGPPVLPPLFHRKPSTTRFYDAHPSLSLFQRALNLDRKIYVTWKVPKTLKSNGDRHPRGVDGIAIVACSLVTG
jgi:hypothetical protein